MTHHDVFICHAPEDEPIAERMCAVLELEHISCWIAPRDLSTDADDAATLDAIASSRVLVLVFSHNADASAHIPLELEAAAARGIPVLPVRVDEATPSGSLQHSLEGSHWLDAVTPPLEDHFHHLAGYIGALLDRDESSPAPVPVAAVSTAAAEAAPPPSPYGPAPTATPGGSPPAGPPPAPAPPDGPFAGGTAEPPPEGRRPVLRWVLIALGALVLVIIGAVVAFAVLFAIGDNLLEEEQSGTGTEAESGTGSDESAPEDDGAEADPDAALAERSCDLLDPADVAAVYGAAADPGTPSSDGFCDFADAGSITIAEEPAVTSTLELYRDVTPVEFTDLPELGGGAFIDEDGILVVLDESRDALLLLVTFDNSPTGRQQLIDLAELIVAG